MMENKTLGKIGEFKLVSGFLDKIRKCRLPGEPHIDAGDDAFAAGMPSGYEIVISTDALVSGVHFCESFMSWKDIGRKAVLVNLSDLAAMGHVEPLYAFVSCALPRSFPLKKCGDLFDGITETACKYRTRIGGGDTVSSKSGVFISVAVVGKARKQHIISRSGAKPGNDIFVTGLCGLSAAGLRLLKGKTKRIRLSPDEKSVIIESHIRPRPQFYEAELLARNHLAASMIDSSDGLRASIGEITRLSGVGARVEVAPIADDRMFRSVCAGLNLDPLRLCVSGGEDYVLVFTVPEEKSGVVEKVLPRAKKIGKIVPSKYGVKYFYGGAGFEPAKGFEHF